MNTLAKNLEWKPIVRGVFSALMPIIGIGFASIVAYAFFIAIQARGAPDEQTISAFADANFGIFAALLTPITTYSGARKAARSAVSNKSGNALAVGVGMALLFIAIDLSAGLSIWTLIGVLLSLAGAWIASQRVVPI